MNRYVLAIDAGTTNVLAMVLKPHQGPEILEDAHIHHMDFHTGGQKLGHVIE